MQLVLSVYIARTELNFSRAISVLTSGIILYHKNFMSNRNINGIKNYNFISNSVYLVFIKNYS